MPDFDTGYFPHNAESGKFVRLTDAELSSLGMTVTGETEGRYAMLVYPVDQTYTVEVATALPDSSEEQPLSLTNGALSAVTFANTPAVIEIYNNSAQNVYFSFTSTTVSDVSTNGMLLSSNSFYSIEHAAPVVRLVADGTADVRVVGHYKA